MRGLYKGMSLEKKLQNIILAFDILSKIFVFLIKKTIIFAQF